MPNKSQVNFIIFLFFIVMQRNFTYRCSPYLSYQMIFSAEVHPKPGQFPLLNALVYTAAYQIFDVRSKIVKEFAVYTDFSA